MEAFSAAANVFAIVGVVDVAYRYGTELYEFFSKVRNASTDARQLLSALQNLVSVLAQVRSLLIDFSKSEIPIDYQALSALQSILKHCEADLNQLQIHAAKVKVANNSQVWFSKVAATWNWALQGQYILQVTQRLEVHKTDLIAALSVLGRHNDIQLRHELVVARKNVETSQRKIYHTVKKTRNEVTKYRTAQRHQSSTILRRISEAESALAKSFAALTLTETNNDTALLEGANLEAIVAPLTFMKSSLVQVIRVLVTSNRLKISATEAGWIKRELENLLASSYLVSAHQAEQRSKIPDSMDEVDHTCRGTPEVEIGNSVEPKPQSRYWQGLPTGTLLLEWNKGCNTHGKDNSGSQTFSMQFTFIPNPLIVDTGLAFWLQIETTHATSVYRRLRIFKTIRSDSAILQQVFKNDVAGLKTLFSRSEISPHDRDQNGRSLLFHAVSFGSIDVAELLMLEGADPLDLTMSLSQPSFMELLWRSWLASFHRQMHMNTSVTDIPSALEGVIGKYRKTTSLAIAKGAETFLASRSGNTLHIFCGSHQSIPQEHWLTVIPFLVEIGCDTEATDDFGQTPLRKALRHPEKDWDLIDILVRSSPSKIMEISWQPSLIHYCLQAMLSELQSGPKEEISRCQQIEDVLEILLQRGSDPNHLDNYLESPLDTVISDRALCRIWEAILQRHDLFVVEISGQEQSQSSWDDNPGKTQAPWSWKSTSRSIICTFRWRFLVVLRKSEILSLLRAILKTLDEANLRQVLEESLPERMESMQADCVTYEILQTFIRTTKLPISGMSFGEWLKGGRQYFRIKRSTLVRSLLGIRSRITRARRAAFANKFQPFEDQMAHVTIKSIFGDATLGFQFKGSYWRDLGNPSTAQDHPVTFPPARSTMILCNTNPTSLSNI